MTHARYGDQWPMGSDPGAEDEILTRKAFLAKSLGALSLSALLANGTSPAQGRDLGEMSTAQYIQSEFNEEAQVAAKYAAFAVQARAEGYPQTARLFQALVLAETFHAEFLLRLMNGVQATADNLKVGADYEAYLARKVLSAAAAQAAREKETKAKTIFEYLRQACVMHEKTLRQAQERALLRKDMDSQPIMVCPRCGAVLVGSHVGPCPICGTVEAKFHRIT